MTYTSTVSAGTAKRVVDGRRMRRLIPERWRTFSATDVVVVGGFLLLFAAKSLLLPVGFLPGSDAVVFGMATSGGTMPSRPMRKVPRIGAPVAGYNVYAGSFGGPLLPKYDKLTFYGSALASVKRAHIGCPEVVAFLPPVAGG